MALPLMQFQPETFQQANPLLAGIGAAQQLYQQGVQNQYLSPMLAQQLRQAQLNNQILSPQAQYAPQMTQAELAYKQAMAPYMQAQTQGILRGQIPLDISEASKNYATVPLIGAQTRLTNTQAAMNQFKLNNPATMLDGIAGNVGSYAVLQELMPQLFGSPNTAPQTATTVAANNIAAGRPTSVPGIPSAGIMPTSQVGNQNVPILPQNPYNNTPSPTPLASNIGNIASQVQQAASGLPASGGLPSVPDMARLLFQNQFAGLNKDVAQTNYYNTQAALAAFRSLPNDVKANILAQGRGLGLSPDQTVSYVSQGGDLNALAQQKAQQGQPSQPMYYPDQKAVVNSQISTAATAALTDINPVITNALAPYSRQFLGHSPKLVMQEISGQDQNSQAQALAARALSPEIAGLRLKAMNAQSGIEAIREVQESSMLGLKNYQGMVSPQVFKMANQYLDSWVARMSNSYNKALYSNTGQINVPPTPNSSVPQANTQNVSQPSAIRTINGVNYHRVNINGKWKWFA